MAWIPLVGGAAVVPESRLKAAFVSKFPQFVEWPRQVLEGRQALDVCIAPPDPFGADLADLLAGEQANGRPLALHRISTAADVPACHLLFLPVRPEGPHPLLGAAAARPILTVGDAPGFLDEGGMVALRVVNGRVRFEIDEAAARRTGLRISSQLLRLAIAVRGGAQ